MSYFGISIKKIFHYRWHLVFSIVSIFLDTIVLIFLWKYIYRDNKEMEQFMIIYAILSSLISMVYSDRCSYNIADKVYKGTFAVDLLRPIHFLKLNFMEVAGEIAANLLIKGLPLMLLWFILYWKLIRSIHLIYACMGILAIGLAFLFYMMLYTTLGTLSFWFYEIWPFNRLMNDTIRFLSGAVIPVFLFPSWLAALIQFLPFRYLYSFPIELILRGSQCEQIGRNFLVLIVWDLIIGTVMLAVYRKALFKCVVQGG